MQVTWLENDFLKIGILVGRGSDIFEFRYKPLDLNFMLKLEKDIHNPREVMSQIRDTANQLEDYYYGGWQEILPNSLAGDYRGAMLGQHGEVWMLPWKHAIIKNTEEEVSIKLWTRPLRVPLLIEKVLTIKKGTATLFIQEELTNESAVDLDIMWGHHIAFGLPFLTDGGFIDTNATMIEAEKSMPKNRRFKSDRAYEWPEITGLDDGPLDARLIPAEDDTPYSELAYLSGFEKKAYYTLFDREKKLGFGVEWDSDIFKYLWYWQERYATKDAPWWGSAYAVALEPWTTKHPSDPSKAIASGQYLRIGSRATIASEMRASVIDKTH